jgi:predicted alpha/beta hydrolase
MLPNSHRADRIYLVASANGYWKLMDGLSKYVMWIFWQVVVPLNIKIFGYFNNRIFGSGGGFPRNIILELRSFCQQSEFFFPFFISKQVVPRYSDIKTRVTAYHLEGDAIANENACRYIYDLYDQADRQFITLKASDHGLKKFGHRSFFSSSAKQIWKDLLTDLESS